GERLVRPPQGPIIFVGSQVAMPGKMLMITIARIMQPMKGSAPLRMVGSLTSGVIALITKRFRPTGGVIRPSSVLIVRMTPNQIGWKPADSITGIRIGVVIRMIAAGGRKQPATSSMMLIASMMTQRLTSIAAIASAMVWVTSSEDIM